MHGFFTALRMTHRFIRSACHIQTQTASLAGGCLRGTLGFLLYLDEDDGKGEQRQRLNKGQAEHEEQENCRPRSWIASDRQ